MLMIPTALGQTTTTVPLDDDQTMVNMTYHNETDLDDDEEGYDVYLVKLTASMEELPACKSDAATIRSGFCFVTNICYNDGDASRSHNDCSTCDSNTSQTELTLEGICTRRLSLADDNKSESSALVRFLRNLSSWLVSYPSP